MVHLPAVPPLDRNGRLVLLGKAFRAFGFGLNSVVLGLYLVELGLDAAAVGAVLSAALVGTTLLTLIIAIFGDRLGRRRVLATGGALMLLSLFVPLVGANPLLLVLIALSGMVAATANENTGLQSLDQAILPQTTDPRHRTAAFATYGLLASVAVALGGLAVGPLVALGTALGLEGADHFAPAFVVYALAGLATVAAAGAMTAGAEPPTPEPEAGAVSASPAQGAPCCACRSSSGSTPSPGGSSCRASWPSGSRRRSGWRPPRSVRSSSPATSSPLRPIRQRPCSRRASA